MFTPKSISASERLEKLIQALNEARQLQQDVLIHGLDAAYLYLDDVEGNWLEIWTEDEGVTESLISFLESDAPVAVRVRQRLGNKSLTEIAGELEQCLNLPTEDERRLFAVKTVLADHAVEVVSSRNEHQHHDEVSLLDLAEELLVKLAEIQDKID